jgi:glycosyltransferase involved in cell wall biosynthesis
MMGMETAPAKNRPLCSVIIPCYNPGNHLQEAVESALASRYPSVEIVIVDDGSTEEETLRLLREYATHPQIQVHYHMHQGPSAARNEAIRRSAGKYILPLDADDKIHPVFIAKAVDALERNEQAGLVSCGVEYFGDRTGRCPLPPYRFPSILLRNSFVCSCVFRRADWAAVGGYKTNLRHGGEDWDFWISLIELGREVVQLDDILFYYRQHGPSRTTGSLKPDHLRETIRTIRENHKLLFRRNRWALLKDRVRWFGVRHGLVLEKFH